ncbi:Putative peptidyl-prolyl cis-trans isomerase Cbf2 precursor [Devosia equisanguinis]|uniref:Parvulin-like PPIase n=1 Tax=Devosia equisanguinis TaxID=2490941 RepID=A0A447IBI2_9HYPH|nr:peptidylprolyl isomerase [Devosia equisanguinis]VDS04939.1 Putative peptidyl-prolyl cis-trans isomerase Cbf2 precursor [Devosia equisanguinis]
MFTHSMRLVRTLSLAALLATTTLTASFAQDAAPAAPAPAATVTPETVVATVGGEAITEADLSFAAEDMAQDLAQMPPEQRRAFLLRVLIDMKVMSGAAKAAGMDQTALFAQRLKYLEERALRRAYFADAIAGAVTEEAVRAAYDAYVADFKPEDEIRASHILVESEDKAKELKAQLDGGADFATLARENSIDPGAANGGDLGFFGPGMMVKPFQDAAFALANPGDISEPVQSQFGWHIIKLEEKRQSSPQPFEQVASQLQQQVLMQTFTKKVDELMSGVTIDVTDPTLKAALDAQDAQDAAAEEGATAQ